MRGAQMDIITQMVDQCSTLFQVLENHQKLLDRAFEVLAQIVNQRNRLLYTYGTSTNLLQWHFFGGYNDNVRVLFRIHRISLFAKN